MVIPEIAITAQALKEAGGAERYTRDVIAGLHRMGIRPTLFAREIDRELDESGWVDARPLDVRWAPRPLRNLAFNWLLGRRLRGHRPRCLFAINHSPYADVALCGGTHPGFLQSMGQRARQRDLWQIALEQKTYANAHTIVAHSQLMAGELRRFYGVPDAKIRVLYPPVDTARFRPLDPAERLAARRELGLPEDRIVFGFSSTGHERKGYGLLEPFFAETRLPICLAVAGRPIPRERETIRYVGYQKDIERFFAAVDFTVVASIYEPFGLVGVESVLCGTPLVIADNVGSAEAVADEAKIVFSRKKAGDFARAIDVALERTRGGNGRINNPVDRLRYAPDVDTHVAALVRILAPDWQGREPTDSIADPIACSTPPR